MVELGGEATSLKIALIGDKMISVEKRVEKLSIPNETMLVEVVSQDGGNNHMIYYIAEDGSIIDFVHVVNTRISDVIRAIPHMMVIERSSLTN